MTACSRQGGRRSKQYEQLVSRPAAEATASVGAQDLARPARSIAVYASLQPLLRGQMLQCPKCRADMRPITHESVEVDRCTRCGGLWFDILEYEDLRSMDGSERIDSGDARVGARLDDQAKAFCPNDGSRLTRMVVADQPHIWYEMCPVCHGAFFDAGEFSDFKERSFAEAILKRGRKRDL